LRCNPHLYFLPLKNGSDDFALERVEERLDKVETKPDAVAADLAAHRADTEIHRTR
jgi:hypothetical protein